MFESFNAWHWVIIALLLLGLELAGTAGYLMWLGISAMVVALISALMPISWQLEVMSFVALSLFTTWIWWRYQHRIDMKDDASSTLNKRMSQLIGEEIMLEQPVTAGKCRVKLGDTTWSAVSDGAYPEGTVMTVTAVEGNTLHVTKKSDEA